MRFSRGSARLKLSSDRSRGAPRTPVQARGLVFEHDLSRKPASPFRDHALERSGMELEALGDVVTLLRNRVGIINPDRAEHGIPDQAGAD